MCFWVDFTNVPPSRSWYDRSRRHGNMSSAAVGTISMTDFSGLLRVEYCVANRAVDVSNPGKLAICANNELSVFEPSSAKRRRTE